MGPENKWGDHRGYLSNQLLPILERTNPTMAAGPHSIDPTAYLDELLSQACPDLVAADARGFH